MRNEWVNCPPDEITWLDRDLVSRNQDLTLHRAPRCAGLRYVHHRWELFSRDTTYRVYLAPHAGGGAPPAEAVQRAARHVLPVAPAHYEALPVVLEEGTWLIRYRHLGTAAAARGARPPRTRPAEPHSDRQPPTQDGRVLARASASRAGGTPGASAVAHVRSYFERNATARMAMAYYYQEYILGLPAPHTTAMMDVVIALNLSGEGAVSD